MQSIMLNSVMIQHNMVADAGDLKLFLGRDDVRDLLTIAFHSGWCYLSLPSGYI